MIVYAVFVKSEVGSYRYIDSQWAVRGDSVAKKDGTARGRVDALTTTFKAFGCSLTASIVELSVMDVAIVETPKAAMQSRVDPKEEDEGSTGLSGSENIR